MNTVHSGDALSLKAYTVYQGQDLQDLFVVALGTRKDLC